ncbi:MAG TPA: hypothetical protein VJP40_06420 [bacterium]|nr:hypothetical protein [bacterium]
MGDTVENNNLVSSCSYEDYSASVSTSEAGPLASYLPEPVVDLTQTQSLSSTSSDSYSQAIQLPRHLSPHDSIRIADGQGGSRVLELIDLVREARSNPSARSQLLTLASAAASDPRVTSSCFVASEENLLPILAQLGSEDAVTRREGALTLRQLILSNPEDRRLQQGLLATVDQIARQNPSNTEARQLLVEIYQDSSPRNSGLRQWMASHTAVPNYVSNAVVANESNRGGTQALSSNGGGTLGGFAVSASLSGDAPSNQASTQTILPLSQLLASPGFAPLATLIEERTQGTPLQGLAPEGVIGFALTHAALPASEFKDLLYLRIMAGALPLNSFTGSQFGQSMIVATNLARDIRRQLDGHGSSERRTLTAGDRAAETELAIASASPRSIPAPAPSGSPLPDPASPVLTAAASQLQGGSIAAHSFFMPALLTCLSGMQGAASQPSTLGQSVLASQAFGLGGHSHYHVEGPTNLDEDSHQGFGGGSQGQQDSGEQDQDGREESNHPQDSYYA